MFYKSNLTEAMLVVGAGHARDDGFAGMALLQVVRIFMKHMR
jgi:hypothetical protein